MNDRFLSYLKQQYRFAEWQNTTTLRERLFVLGVAPAPESFSGWEPQEVRRIPAETGLATSHALANSLAFDTSAPHTIQSLWRRAARPAAQMAVDLLQCSSRLAAHDLLLRLLGEFQALGVARIGDAAIGDVAFAAGGAYVIAFARANLVLFMRNAGRDLVSLEETAAQLDRDLVAKPVDAPVLDVSSLAVRLAPNAAQPSGERPIELDARTGSHKFYSSSGDVEQRGQQLVYIPLSDAGQHLEVYSSTPEGIVRRAVQFGGG